MEIVDWITPALLLGLFAWLRHDIGELRQKVAELAERVANVETSLGERIAIVETSLGERLASVEATLDIMRQGLRIEFKRQAQRRDRIPIT